MIERAQEKQFAPAQTGSAVHAQKLGWLASEIFRAAETSPRVVGLTLCIALSNFRVRYQSP